MRRGWTGTVLLSCVIAAHFGCGDDVGGPGPDIRSTQRRRFVLWLQGGALDEATAQRLRAIHVDEVAVRRGRIDLGGEAPVLRLTPGPSATGGFPVGVVLEVERSSSGLGRAMADAVWRGLDSELGDVFPAEVILDIPDLNPDLAHFIADFSEVAGVPVVPILDVDQLREDAGRQIAVAAGNCIVPAFGTDGADLRGVGALGTLPLEKKLEPLADTNVRVRLGIVLRPRTEPPLDTAGLELNGLTEGEIATISTTSTLDRTFVFERATEWAGRSWRSGQAVAVRWMDAARLHSALAEIQRLVTPEVGGWDLVPFPGGDQTLGLSQDALIRYFEGEGPEPAVTIGNNLNGRNLTVTLSNMSPFASTVSTFGNWIEVAIDSGRIAAEGRGAFDRIALGTVRNGKWSQGGIGGMTAVRYTEFYLAPGEVVETGVIRLPSNESQFTIRWNLILSDGREIGGRVVPNAN